MTEQQPYETVRTYPDFELRRYPAHLLAEVQMDAPFRDAGNNAFRYLFAYITGENRSASKVEMTAPVVQADASTKIAMTAPVIQQAQNQQQENAAQYRVAFVLPASLTLESAPEPTNPRVQLRVVPESLTAALRFRGRWSEANYQGHRTALLSAVASAHLVTIGPPRFARFDPPFKPWFLRHNEVLIDVEGEAQAKD